MNITSTELAQFIVPALALGYGFSQLDDIKQAIDAIRKSPVESDSVKTATIHGFHEYNSNKHAARKFYYHALLLRIFAIISVTSLILTLLSALVGLLFVPVIRPTPQQATQTSQAVQSGLPAQPLTNALAINIPNTMKASYPRLWVETDAGKVIPFTMEGDGFSVAFVGRDGVVYSDRMTAQMLPLVIMFTGLLAGAVAVVMAAQFKPGK